MTMCRETWPGLSRRRRRRQAAAGGARPSLPGGRPSSNGVAHDNTCTTACNTFDYVHVRMLSQRANDANGPAQRVAGLALAGLMQPLGLVARLGQDAAS